MRLIKKLLPWIILAILLWWVATSVDVQKKIANLTKGMMFKKYYTPPVDIKANESINDKKFKL